MKSSRTRLLVAVVILLLAGLGVAGYLVVSDGDGEDGPDDGALGTTSTTVDDGPVLTTSTTAAAGSTTASSTTVASSTTSTTTAGSTTTTTGGSATSTSSTTAPSGVCGTGTARVTFAAKDLTTTAAESAFVPEARVENLINRPIEVEVLVVDVTYPDGVSRQVTFTTAGVVIAPSTTATYTSERLVTPKQYTAAKVARFAYFTQGQKDRCRVSL